MNELLKRANKIVMNGGLRHSYGTRQPAQYADKGYEYFADASHLHREQMLQYASDFFPGAMVQNWDRGGEWENVPLRMANVIKPTAAINRALDEYKMVIPEDPTINYLRPGTKIQCMGSTWLVVNPDNISGGDGMAIVRQCKAVWNHLDFYGNVVSEPVIVDLDIFGHANASAPDTQNTQNIATGYYNITCQYNDFTKQINDNTRLILGSKAYQVTGYGDFIQEFTSDTDSVRLVSFAVRVLTSADDSDDMEKRVAGGKNFSWVPYFYGPEQVSVNASEQAYRVISSRNGEQTEDSSAHPISYSFAVDDPETAQIQQVLNEYFWLIPKKLGTVTVTATLNQNQEIKAQFSVSIVAGGRAVRFDNGGPDEAMQPHQTFPLQAKVFNENGVAVNLPVTFTPSGARDGSYSITRSGNTAIVTCYGYSETPLTVTATCDEPGYEGLSDTATIYLEGF